MNHQTYSGIINPATMKDVGRWRTGCLTRMPYMGLLAIGGVIACIAAAIAVLARSDGRPIHEWAVQPTVWLAVTSAIASACLHFALAEGVAISWWRKAIRGGTIQDLHNHWDFGNSLVSVLFSGKRFNLVALASVVATISIINGPLLQRASTVVNQAPKAAADLQVQISSNWNDLHSGIITGRTQQTSMLSKSFVKAMQDYTNRAGIKMNHTGCDATCSTSIRGAGFGVTCTDSIIPLNLTIDIATIGQYTTIFSTNFAHSAIDSTRAITMTVVFKNTTECDVTSAISKTCVLRPSTIEYPILVSNDTVTLSPAPGVWENDTVILHQNITFSSGPGPTVLGGFALAANNQFNSSAEMAFGGGVGWEMQTSGSLANVYATNEITNCSLSFSDPTYDLLAAIREITFRYAIAASNSSDAQVVGATVTGTVTAYKSNYIYLTIACAILLVGAVVVLSIFYGWWELGRKVSLSPIETAKAFSAPMLQSENWNAEVKTILKEVGDRDVRYGEVLTVDGTPIPGHVMVPGGMPIMRRLEMADPSWARPPTKGTSYNS